MATRQCLSCLRRSITFDRSSSKLKIDKPAIVHGEEVDASREQAGFRHSKQKPYAKEAGLISDQPLADGDYSPDESKEREPELRVESLQSEVGAKVHYIYMSVRQIVQTGVEEHTQSI